MIHVKITLRDKPTEPTEDTAKPVTVSRIDNEGESFEETLWTDFEEDDQNGT